MLRTKIIMAAVGIPLLLLLLYLGGWWLFVPATAGSLKKQRVRVGPSSTIRVQHNVYAVHSRLIGEAVEIRIFLDRLEVWYAQQRVESLPRLRGECRHHIQYRHIIDRLVRKPGAFAQYHYREDLFPSSHFRMAYDALRSNQPDRADREYLKILHLAARETERAFKTPCACCWPRSCP